MRRAVTAEEFQKVCEEHMPIDGLKVGDKLRWKKGMRNAKVPLEDEVITVFSTSPLAQNMEKGTPVRRYDFSALFFDNDGELMEFNFDSRFFERVEG